MTRKRIYRDKDNGVILGVCEGVGNYLNIDPVFIRIIWLFTFLTYGVGIIAYLVAALLIPDKST